jgi:hypothetical protein
MFLVSDLVEFISELLFKVNSEDFLVILRVVSGFW